MEFYSKDIQILRQSQIKLVLEMMTLHNVVPTVLELQKATDIFVECGLKPMDNDLKLKVKNLDEWLKKKKEENKNLKKELNEE